jgi:branched-chain amino acid aminotransferase
MENKIYINGVYYPKSRAKISVYDHGLLYGDGVFEGIHIYGGAIFKLEEHIARLYESARAIHLQIPLTVQEMERALVDAVRRNEKSDGYIRLIVTRGNGDLGLNPDYCKQPTVIIIVDDIALYPEEYYQRGIAVITATTRRMDANTIDPRIKSLNYLNNILAKIESKQAGCMEAIMLNHDGYVTECTGDNFFIIKDSILSTPHEAQGILKGITRGTVLELARQLGVNCAETILTRFDCYTADECFLTGTGAEIMPVVKIDGRTIGSGTPGKTTRMLSHAFKALAYRNTSEEIKAAAYAAL